MRYLGIRNPAGTWCRWASQDPSPRCTILSAHAMVATCPKGLHKDAVMDENKGLKILSQTLGWTDEEARTQFRWLKMMAAIKYDDYRDFLPGVRFLENLAGW